MRHSNLDEALSAKRDELSEAIEREDDEAAQRIEREITQLQSDAGVTPVYKSASFLNEFTTHVEIARHFAHWYGTKAMFVHGVGWYAWAGTHWQEDATKRVQAFAKGLIAEMTVTAKKQGHKEVAGLIRGVGKSHGIRSVLELAESEGKMSRTVDGLNVHPEKLACANGTIDLQSGEFKERFWDRGHRITRCAPAEYVEGATDERFDALLEHLIPDTESRAWLQKAIGYSILGNPKEDRIFLMIGPTAAGKGTFLAAIEAAIGDFFTTARMESFCTRRHGDDPSKPRADLFALRDRRMVAADEVNRGHRFNAGMLKNVSGGGYLNVRGLRRDDIRVKVGFVLWVVTNPGDVPKLPSDDDAIWRRVVQFHIGGSIPEDQRDPDFRDKTVKEPEFRTAVLAWIVEGAKRYHTEGLGAPPQSVAEATGKLREDMNTYGPLFEHLEFRSQYVTPKKYVRALAEELLGFKPSDKNLVAALERRAETHDVVIRRTSKPVESTLPDGTTKKDKLPAWRGLRIVEEDN